MSLISELKRRNVLRAAFAYAVVWWLLVQVAGLLLDAFDAPDWIFRGFIILLALGFPVAIVLSWFFEITTDGLVRSEDLPKKEAELRAFRRYLNPLIISMLSAAVILFALDKFGWISSPLKDGSIEKNSTSETQSSLAVLPFINRSNVIDNAYFVDGMHDDLLTMLTKIKSFSVTSRTSVMRYRDSDLSIPEISDILKVDFVLEGGVQRDGEFIRVNAQLIDAERDEHLWAETFDRKLSAESLFAIQSGIARAIATALDAELSNEDKRVLDSIPTESLAAYDVYLQGRQSLLGHSVEAYQRAITYFDQAISLDPLFAGAYAGLCQTHLSWYRNNSDIKQFNMAEAACDRALSIDANLTEVHIALGALFRHHGNYQRAEGEQRLALVSEPQNVEAMIELGMSLALQGRIREGEIILLQAETLQPDHWPVHGALNTFYRLYDDQPDRYERSARYAMRVVELSPKNAAAWNNLGSAYHSLQQYDAAKTAWDRVLELSPTRTAYTNRGLQYFYEGRYADSAEMQIKATEIAPNDHRAWGRLADSYRLMGQHEDQQRESYVTAIRLAKLMLGINDQDWKTSALLSLYYVHSDREDDARTLIESSLELSKRNPEALLYASLMYISLEEQETTLQLLEEMVERDDSYRNYAREDPDFQVLRGNDRYEQLINS